MSPWTSWTWWTFALIAFFFLLAGLVEWLWFGPCQSPPILQRMKKFVG
jgi:hypothetical protein